MGKEGAGKCWVANQAVVSERRLLELEWVGEGGWAGGWFVRCGLWLRAGCTTSNQLSAGPGQAKASHPAPQPKHPNCGRTGTIVIMKL